MLGLEFLGGLKQLSEGTTLANALQGELLINRFEAVDIEYGEMARVLGKDSDLVITTGWDSDALSVPS